MARAGGGGRGETFEEHMGTFHDGLRWVWVPSSLAVGTLTRRRLEEKGSITKRRLRSGVHH